MTGIYVVTTASGRSLIVIAPDAGMAAKLAGDKIYADGRVERAGFDTGRWEVGRLGDYRPMAGAAQVVNRDGPVFG